MFKEIFNFADKLKTYVSSKIDEYGKPIEMPLEDDLNSSEFNDVLNISNLLDKFVLDNLGSQGIFIDTNNYNDAFSFKGRYALSNDEITITGKLFKGEKVISDFSFEGLKEDLDALLEKILRVWYDK